MQIFTKSEGHVHLLWGRPHRGPNQGQSRVTLLRALIYHLETYVVIFLFTSLGFWICLLLKKILGLLW